MTESTRVRQAVIRRARGADAAMLSDLALRSKGHWGYDATFLEACRAELTQTPDFIEASPVCVLEAAGAVLGFYALDGRTPEAELLDLFVEPAAIGRGHGGRLLRHALATARAFGARTLRIEADPYAAPFYRAMGAERIGEAPSGSIPGRVLPLLRLRLIDADG